mgnify:CR=1 FL=1
MKVEEYVEAYKKEINREEEKRNLLFKKLNEKARQAARQLGSKYNLDKIYLFGSLINKDKFRLNSDIDLAVKGLSSQDYLAAWGDLEDHLGYSFDLVQMEKANNLLVETIKEEGEVIYESRRSQGK